MCLVVLAIDQHRDYPLVLLANRDEFYVRPASALQPWPQWPMILAGKDLAQGGTWAAWQHDGRFALLTNIRRPDALTPGKRSRGELPLRFLQQKLDPFQYASTLAQVRDDYAPFNLLYGSLERPFYLSSDDFQPYALGPGLHGLSNAALNTPWPKVEYAKQELAVCLQSTRSPATESLFACVARVDKFPDEQLPDTGVPIAWERTLSPPFIRSADYGTRSSLVVVVDRERRLCITERSYVPQHGPRLYHERSFCLRLSG